MTISKDFIKMLKQISENESLISTFLKEYIDGNDDSFITILNQYKTYFNKLTNPEDKNKLSHYFWEVIKSLNLPLIEVDQNGISQVYFLYRKSTEENIDDIYVQGDYHGYGSTFLEQRLNRLGDSDIMFCITPIKKEFEYALITYHFVEVPRKNNANDSFDLNDNRNWVADPYAKHTKAFETSESQFCVNAGNDMTRWLASEIYKYPSYANIQKDPRLIHLVQKPDGQIVNGLASFTDDLRSIHVFKPTEKIENVVIVNDGFAYLFCNIVNHLQQFAEKEKCVFIFISPHFGLGIPKDHPLGLRGLEYHLNVDQYTAFILNDLLPELNKQGVLPNPHPTNMTVIGASMSGTAALRMGLTHSDRFRQVIAQSPAPIGRDMIDNIPNVRSTAGQMRIDIECGRFETPKYAYANDNMSYTQELGKLLNVDVHVGLHGHQTEAWVVDLKRSLAAVLSLTYAGPKISKLQPTFFNTAAIQRENKLMPVSTSWWELELAEKREVLEMFWWQRIISFNQKSVDEFKKNIIEFHFPKSDSWKLKIEKLFSDAIARKIDFAVFFAELKYLPMIHIRGMANFEKIPLPHADKVIEPKLKIGPADLINIKRYMLERGMTGSIAFGFSDGELLTPEYSESSRCSYAMHSVGKVFTGMLTLLMIQKGILIEKEVTEPLSKEFIESLTLPLSLKKHLLENKITLHQLMTHKAGLGDYLEEYGKAISSSAIPEINRAEDFLLFAETNTYPVGKERYSNLGILLVGLPVKHAYEKKHGTCEYHDILSKYIIDKIEMPSFSSKRPIKNSKYNPVDSMAPHIAGSPAGGYWITASDLAKFGLWIYNSCQNNPNLLELIKKYGQEFYNKEHNMISHGGATPSSSAFLSVSLNTGAVIATLSDQPDMAFELNSMMQTHVFGKRQKIVEEKRVTAIKKGI